MVDTEVMGEICDAWWLIPEVIIATSDSTIPTVHNSEVSICDEMRPLFLGRPALYICGKLAPRSSHDSHDSHETYGLWAIRVIGFLQYHARAYIDTSSMKWESGVFPCHGMVELPRIHFGHEQGNLRSTRLVLIKWLKRGRRKKREENF